MSDNATNSSSFFAQVSRLFESTQATPELDGVPPDSSSRRLQDAFKLWVKQGINQQLDQFVGSSGRLAKGTTDMLAEAAIVVAQETQARLAPGAFERILARTARGAGEALFDALADELRPAPEEPKAQDDTPKHPSL